MKVSHWSEPLSKEFLDLDKKVLNELRKWQVLEMIFENLTHVFIGGYNARTTSTIQLDKEPPLVLKEYVRTSEIKGLWRWWFRACCGGVLWDSGLTDDAKLEELAKKKTHEVLGSTKSTSRFIIHVDTIKAEPSAIDTKLYTKELPPRLKLRGIKVKESKKTKETEDILMCYKPGSLKFRLTVFERPKAKGLGDASNEELGAVIGSLLLALTLNGIGSMTRRGLGSLRVLEVRNDKTGLGRVVKELYDMKTKEEIEKEINDLIQHTRKYFEEFLKCKINEAIKPSNTSIPPFPVLSSDPAIFRLNIEEVVSKGPIDVLEILNRIGKAFMKVEWKRLYNLNSKHPGENIHTWILGLPRSQKPPKNAWGPGIKLGVTGYAGPLRRGEVLSLRRPSAISAKVITQSGNKWFVAIFGFLSRDWPDFSSELFHYSTLRSKGIPVQQLSVLCKNKEPKSLSLKQEFLKCVFDVAYDNVRQLIRGR